MRRKKQKAMKAAQDQEMAIAFETVKVLEDMRQQAIAVIDRTDQQFEEMLRTGVCPSCETISTIEDVEKQPEHELHEAAMGHEAIGFKEWKSTHSEDCSFYRDYQALPTLAGQFHIVIANKRVTIPQSDGTAMTDFAPVRVPAIGDPPIPE
jgi:hypothetical protein